MTQKKPSAPNIRRSSLVFASDLSDSHAMIFPPGAVHATAADNSASLSSPRYPASAHTTTSYPLPSATLASASRSVQSSASTLTRIAASASFSNDAFTDANALICA